MTDRLETPCSVKDPDCGRLYRARGEEVVAHRPLFTGDVFERTEIQAFDGTAKRKNVIIVQHPCAMRTNGVDLAPQLLVAEVRKHRMLSIGQWEGYGKLMPLPDLFPAFDSGRRHQAAFFDALYLVAPSSLTTRVACLSQLGVNLLMQRWVHHNSRVVVPSWKYNEATTGVYEEADLIEEWCDNQLMLGASVESATADCVSWLREEVDGSRRQELLDDPQSRSTVRRQMLTELKERR